MKDFCKTEEDDNGKVYYNENDQLHRLIGAAIEYKDGDRSYYINYICYMIFDKNYNELYIYSKILELILEYEQYIKQNIEAALRSKDLIEEYSPKIELCGFTKERINQLPNWLKDLIIL